MRAGLSSRSVKRMVPNYDLVEEIPCPSDYDASASLLTPDKSSNGGDTGSVGTVDSFEIASGKKRKRPPPKSNAPSKSTNKRVKTTKTLQTKTKTPTSTPLPESATRPTTSNTTHQKLTPSHKRIGITAREAYERAMARDQGKIDNLGGPSSASESEPDDDGIDSD